jgi:hypothetical protein
MAAFTLIFPHKRNPANDKAAKIALDMLLDNTVNDFILLMDAADNKPLYPRVNAMIQAAPTEYCIYWSSDMFPAPGWDVPFLQLAAPDAFVTSVLVEPGAIGVWPGNQCHDFGRRADNFNRASFEAYCATAEMPGGEGWYAPVLYPRAGFLAMGGLADDLQGDHHGFTCADIELFNRWTAAGNRIVRARSYAYHLQRYSEPSEQEDAKRS